MNCIINGCIIVDASYPRWINSDLYQYGDVYIAVSAPGHRHATGETDWQIVPRPAYYPSRALVITDNRALFDRRGILVIPQNAATLNDEAMQHTQWTSKS